MFKEIKNPSRIKLIKLLILTKFEIIVNKLRGKKMSHIFVMNKSNNDSNDKFHIFKCNDKKQLISTTSLCGIAHNIDELKNPMGICYEDDPEELIDKAIELRKKGLSICENCFGGLIGDKILKELQAKKAFNP